MITQKRIDSFLDKHRKIKYTTRTILLNSGFTDRDIRTLIDLGVLKRTGPGQYYIQKQNEVSINIDEYYQKIYEVLLQKDYDLAIKYFYDIFKSNKEINKNDTVFYLYLLSLIIDINNTSLKEYLVKNKEDMLPKSDSSIYLNDERIQKIKEEILDNNYIVALKLLSEIEKERNLSIKEMLLLCLLKQIIEKNIINKNTIKLSIKSNNKYVHLKEYLRVKDNYNVVKTLKEYLSNIDKLEYLPLLINMIKLCLLKRDKNYDLLFDLLDKITYGEYEYNFMEYVYKFYDAFINKDYEEAKIYLLIIREMEEVKKCFIVSSLEKLLEHETCKEKNKEIDVSNEDRKFIKNLFDGLIESYSPVILDNLSEDKIKIYISLLNDYPVHIQICKDLLIIIYTVCKEILPNSYELLWKMEKCYEEKNYQKCAKIGLLLLQNSFFETRIYFLMSESYYQMGNFKLAKTYLRIYKLLSEKDKKTQEKSVEDKDVENKSVEEKKIKEKYTIYHKYFGIKNFQEIDELIRNSGLSVYDACLNMGFDNNKICVILLVYAKEYYNQGFIKKGNEFLNAANDISGKSKRVLKIFDFVNTNKKLVKNGVKDSTLILSLTLKSNC